MLRKLILSASLLALAACSVGPDYAPPALAAPAPAFATATPAVSAELAADRWWTLYGDPVLDRLVDDALAHNTDLREAVANVAVARAGLREVGADRLPQTAVSAGADYGRLPASQRAPGASREDWNVQGGFSVAYEVDLFGRVSRNIEAARGDLGEAEGLADTVRVAVIAETVRAYFDLTSAAERLAVQNRIVDLIGQTATLTGKRFEAGRTDRLDVARVSSLREQQRAAISPLQAERDRAGFRLATLTGRQPQDLPAEVAGRTTTPRLTQPIPVGDGASLIARRPDVRAAERRLAADSARIGVATSELYPRITLGGSVTSTSSGVGNIFGAGPLGWLLGGLVSWNVPDQTAARARIEAAQAGRDGSLAAFDGAVLQALEETETALNAYAHELDRRTALAAAQEQASVAVRIVRAQLREGRADSLAVLDAERSFAETEAALAAADARIASAQVDLFRALGGGWSERRS
jgi:NodT family efflux transporter outer membrane factor (OMF) lipoprotein